MWIISFCLLFFLSEILSKISLSEFLLMEISLWRNLRFSWQIFYFALSHERYFSGGWQLIHFWVLKFFYSLFCWSWELVVNLLVSPLKIIYLFFLPALKIGVFTSHGKTQPLSFQVLILSSLSLSFFGMSIKTIPYFFVFYFFMM